MLQFTSYRTGPAVAAQLPLLPVVAIDFKSCDAQLGTCLYQFITMVLIVEHIDHSYESFRLLTWSESVSSVDVLGAEGSRRVIRGEGAHWHVHSEAELTLVESGPGTRVIGDSIAPSNPPELVLIGPHVPHSWDLRSASSGFAIQFAVDHTQPLRAAPEWSLIATTLQMSSHGLIFSRDVVDQVRDHIEQMIDVDPLGRLAKFLQILSVLAHSKATKLSSKSYTAIDTTTHFPAIQKVVLSILDRYHEPLELDDVVELAQMSRSTFCRDFRSYTGRSFIEFLNEVRVDAVSRQLLLSDEPISEIAFNAGFGNLSNFNRVFRRLKGVSPRDFRATACRSAT